MSKYTENIDNRYFYIVEKCNEVTTHCRFRGFIDELYEYYDEDMDKGIQEYAKLIEEYGLNVIRSDDYFDVTGFINANPANLSNWGRGSAGGIFWGEFNTKVGYMRKKHNKDITSHSNNKVLKIKYKI